MGQNINFEDPDEKSIIINADLSNVQTTLTSNSTVDVEALTCNVSSDKYGLIINRTREAGSSTVMKLDSSSLSSKSINIEYTQSEASWVSGVYYNKKIHWALNGSGWKMTLDETGSLEIGANNNGASTGIKN